MESTTFAPVGCVVTSDQEIDRLRRFQSDRYAATGLVTSADELLGPDPLGPRSTWFEVLGPSGEIWATSRFISTENHSLPLFGDFELDSGALQVLDGHDCQVSEVSRLAVAPEAPSIPVFLALIKAMVHEAVLVGRHTVLVAAVEPQLVRVIRRVLYMDCQIIGPRLEDYYNTTNVPIMMDGVRWLADLRFRNAELWSYFVDGMVLHPDLLRDGLPSVERELVL